MRKDAIMGALRDSGIPVTVDQLSEKVGIPVPKLRLDLYLLEKEGDVEKREEGKEIKWTVRVPRHELTRPIVSKRRLL